MELLSYIKRNPVDFTYFAIGSCPHTWGSELTEKLDQLLPKFVREEIYVNPENLFRAIHFDPAFARYPEELETYFKEMTFEQSEETSLPCFQLWRSNHYFAEIILLIEPFDHPSAIYPGNSEWILEQFVKEIVKDSEQKLIVQEYTGEETLSFFKRLFLNSTEKTRFLNQILFDVSYGANTGCSTDMSKYKPFRNSQGDFYNLLLLDHLRISKIIGVNTEMDTRIKQILIQDYKQILNSYHVDYRRRLRGEGILFVNNDYTETTTPDTIMEILLKKLYILLQILQGIRHVPQESVVRFKELSNTYRGMDVYKWYEEVSQLVVVVH